MAGAFRSMTVIVTNESNAYLDIHGQGEKHGIWVDAFPIPSHILQGSPNRPGVGAWRTESDGASTDAWASYTLNGRDNPTFLIMSWRSPVGGDPEADWEIKGPKAQDFAVTVICSAEGNATCRFIVSNAQKKDVAQVVPQSDALTS
ncbi:MAG: hypothetical protein HQL86_03725 [Magnetococcales bacterium]|nr:hypothetical protein [Magnetococcales bacterium]